MVDGGKRRDRVVPFVVARAEPFLLTTMAHHSRRLKYLNNDEGSANVYAYESREDAIHPITRILRNQRNFEMDIGAQFHLVSEDLISTSVDGSFGT